MAEETNMDVAAEGQDMDSLLNEAAADAVSDAEVEVQTEVEEEPTEEEGIVDESETVQEELDDDGLPLDHGARSELGRKVAASHRRMDEFGAKIDLFDSRLDKLLGVLEKEHSPEEEYDPDMPLTYGEYQRLEQQREEQRVRQQETYNNDYISTISDLGKEVDEDTAEMIIAEMRENVRYTPTRDAVEDARRNFLKATQLVLRKKTATPLKKKNPLEGNKGKVPGTIKGQVVTKTNKPLPKLDAATEDYLAYVTSTRGEEAATKMRKDLA